MGAPTKNVQWALLPSIIVFALGIASFCVAGIMATAHGLVQYTVVNETTRDLLTWGMEGDCSRLSDRRGDYTRTEIVPAGGRLEYFGYGPWLHADCIHVATMDRRLVLVEPYEDGAVVSVAEPLTIRPEPVPSPEDLSVPSAWERWVTEAPLPIRIFEAALLLLGLGLSGMLVSGAMLLLWRRGEAS